MKKAVTFQIVVWKMGKSYAARCLNVDINSYGPSRGIALRNMKESLETHFQDARIDDVVEVEEPAFVTQSL